MHSALPPAGQPPVPLSALVSGLGLTGDTGSRALVTSSQMMSFGLAASDRAMQTRCFWPPDSSAG